VNLYLLDEPKRALVLV